MRRYFFLLFLFFCAHLVWSHGTKTEVFYDGLVGIKAAFDTGQPMVHCKVLIFAPGSTDVAINAITDANGIVCFAPDKAGIWTVQIRGQDGHGARVDIDVDESLHVNTKTLQSNARFSPVQIAVMAVCVVWALLATGLLIVRRGKK